MAAHGWPDLPRPVLWRKSGKGENTPTLGRKFCSSCGRWRHVVDFGSHSWSARGVCLRQQAQCTTCMRIRKRLAGGYSQRRVGRMTHEEVNERARERARALDGERRELRKEYQRIWKEAQRRAAGIPERQWGERASRGDGAARAQRLPARPVLAAIERYAACRGLGLEVAANHARVDSRRLREWRQPGSEIQWAIADRVLQALGLHWWDVWTDDNYEEAARVWAPEDERQAAAA